MQPRAQSQAVPQQMYSQAGYQPLAGPEQSATGPLPGSAVSNGGEQQGEQQAGHVYASEEEREAAARAWEEYYQKKREYDEWVASQGGPEAVAAMNGGQAGIVAGQ